MQFFCLPPTAWKALCECRDRQFVIYRLLEHLQSNNTLETTFQLNPGQVRLCVVSGGLMESQSFPGRDSPQSCF